MTNSRWTRGWHRRIPTPAVQRARGPCCLAIRTVSGARTKRPGGLSAAAVAVLRSERPRASSAPELGQDRLHSNSRRDPLTVRPTAVACWIWISRVVKYEPERVALDSARPTDHGIIWRPAAAGSGPESGRPRWRPQVLLHREPSSESDHRGPRPRSRTRAAGGLDAIDGGVGDPHERLRRRVAIQAREGDAGARGAPERVSADGERNCEPLRQPRRDRRQDRLALDAIAAHGESRSTNTSATLMPQFGDGGHGAMESVR